jgi:hypothetical protein
MTTNAEITSNELYEREEHAYERVRATIGDRLTVIDGRLAAAGESGTGRYIAMHVLPLFPPLGGVDLATGIVHSKWKLTLPFGTRDLGKLRFSLDGVINHAPADAADDLASNSTLLRSGVLEFVDYEVAQRTSSNARDSIILDTIEDDILRSVEEIEHLAVEPAWGWLTAPVAIGLTLRNVSGLRVLGGAQRIESPGVSGVKMEPMIIRSWGASGPDSSTAVVVRLFHALWQAFGFPRSSSYNWDGVRQRSAYR